MQNRSAELSLHLKNHKSAGRKISLFVRSAYVAPDLMNTVLRDGPGTSSDAFLAALHSLSAKLFFHQLPAIRCTHAAADVAPALAQLVSKAAARVRASLLAQVHALRQPKTSVQARQSVLVRDRDAYTFLLTHFSAAGAAALGGEDGAISAHTHAHAHVPAPAGAGAGAGSVGSNSSSASASAMAAGAAGAGAGAGANAGRRSGSQLGSSVSGAGLPPTSSNSGSSSGVGSSGSGSGTSMVGSIVSGVGGMLTGSDDDYYGPSSGTLALTGAPPTVDLAAEVSRAYVESLTGLYTQQFKTYLAGIRGLEQQTRVRKDDLLGSEQGGPKAGGLFGVGRKTADDLLRVFSIGQRELVLTSLAKDSVIIHAATRSGLSTPFERLFRSAHQLLLDTVSSEMEFLWNFFGPGADDDSKRPGAGPGGAGSTGSAGAGAGAGAGTGVGSGVMGAGLGGGEDEIDEDEDPDGDDPLSQIARSVASGGNSYASSISSSSSSKNGGGLPPPSMAGKSGFAPSTTTTTTSSSSSSSSKKLTYPDDDDDNDTKEPMSPTSPPRRPLLARSFVDRCVHEARARAARVRATLDPLRAHHVHTMFTAIFAPALSLLMEHLENHLFASFDSIGVLILIRIVALHNHQAQERNVSALDSFFDRLSLLLWTKFKTLFDRNFASLTAAKALPIKKGSLGAHFVVQRYAEYAAALRRLNYGFHDEVIEVGLSRMARTVEGVVAALAVKAAGGETGVAAQRIIHAFTINNYDVIVRTLHSKGLADAPEASLYCDLATAASTQLVEAELSTRFPDLISFVKEQESRLARGAAAGPAPDDAKVEKIVRGFISTWRSALDATYTSLQACFQLDEQRSLAPAPALASPMAAFTLPGAGAGAGGKGGMASPRSPGMSSLLGVGPAMGVMTTEEAAQAQALALMGIGSDTGSEVLKKCLLQLVLYYKRFQDVVGRIYSTRQPGFLREMIPVQTILYEIKKFGARG